MQAYVDRFNDESLQVESRSDQVVISAFMNGLNPGKLYTKLAQNTPKTIGELLQYVEHFQKGEDANRKKRENEKTEKKTDDKSKASSSTRGGVHDRLNYNRGRQEPRMPNKNLTPLTKPRAEILALHRDVLRPPPPLIAPPHKRNRDLWCYYHNDHGHDTEDCNDLKKEGEGASVVYFTR